MSDTTRDFLRAGFRQKFEAFEELWRQGEEPDLAAYLPDPGPGYARELIELITADLEMRLRKGQQASIRQNLDRFPGLGLFPGDIIQLIEREIRTRTAFALAVPDLEEYRKDFPELEASLGRVFRRLGSIPPEIPDFENLEVIGQGGMGVVYRARPASLERDVALKIIRPDRVSDPDMVDSFRDQFRFEARKMAGVDHPHVVRIYGTGEFGPDLYLAMELVEGKSLKRILDKDGVLDPMEGARLAAQVASGVAAIHATGIIHRDLKPDNVLVTTSGRGPGLLANHPTVYPVVRHGEYRLIFSGDRMAFVGKNTTDGGWVPASVVQLSAIDHH